MEPDQQCWVVFALQLHSGTKMKATQPRREALQCIDIEVMVESSSGVLRSCM